MSRVQIPSPTPITQLKTKRFGIFLPSPAHILVHNCCTTRFVGRRAGWEFSRFFKKKRLDACPVMLEVKGHAPRLGVFIRLYQKAPI
jgi:hypothetical protein